MFCSSRLYVHESHSTSLLVSEIVLHVDDDKCFRPDKLMRMSQSPRKWLDLSCVLPPTHILLRATSLSSPWYEPVMDDFILRSMNCTVVNECVKEIRPAIWRAVRDRVSLLGTVTVPSRRWWILQRAAKMSRRSAHSRHCTAVRGICSNTFRVSKTWWSCHML